MKRVYIYILLVLSAAVFAGCADEREKASPMAESAFHALYPKNKAESWSSHNGYEIASFDSGSLATEVWFNAEGWVMSISNLPFGKLPTPVIESFGEEDFSNWEINNALKLERKGSETLYVVEIERNKVKYDLYFTTNGILVKKSDETNAKNSAEKYLPQELPSAVGDSLRFKYPNSIAYEYDIQKNVVEINFIDNGDVKKSLFLTDGTWIMTTCRINKNTLPNEVSSTLRKDMPDHEVIEASLTETRTGSYYTVECENGNITQTVYLNSNGTMVD